MKVNASKVGFWFLIIASGTAFGQSIEWTQRVRGLESPPGTYEAYAPAIPREKTRPLMDWSGTGTPGVVLAGRHDVNNGLVVKLSPNDGSELWRSIVTSWYGIRINDIQVDTAGDVVTAGEFTVTAVGIYQFWGIDKRSGATGAELWHKHVLPPSGNGAIEAIAIDSANDILALGSRREETNAASYVIKLSGATGDVVWSTPIPYYVSPGGPAWIAVDSFGSAFASPRAGIVAKVHSNGALAWDVNLSSTPELICAVVRALKIDPVSGDALVAGRKNCDPPYEAFVVRLASASGAVVWATNDPGSADSSEISALAFDGNGSVVAAGGRAQGFAAQRWFAAKLSLADGVVTQTLAGPGASSDAPTDIAIAPDGIVLLTGVCEGNAFCAARLGSDPWSLQTGDPYVLAQGNYPNTILAAGGGVFFGGKDTSGGATTWTVHRVDNAIADAIFENGFE